MTQEEELDKFYELGKITAREDIASDVLNRAGEQFKRDKVEIAQCLKDLATELRKDAIAMRKAYDIKYPTSKIENRQSQRW